MKQKEKGQVSKAKAKKPSKKVILYCLVLVKILKIKFLKSTQAPPKKRKKVITSDNEDEDGNIPEESKEATAQKQIVTEREEAVEEEELVVDVSEDSDGDDYYRPDKKRGGKKNLGKKSIDKDVTPESSEGGDHGYGSDEGDGTPKEEEDNEKETPLDVEHANR